MKTRPALIFMLVLMRFGTVQASETSAPVEWPQAIEQMKNAARGPFARIRWFCSDGRVLAPEPYACRNHGGGIQHGQWHTQALQLRESGYTIANVLADLEPDRFFQNPEWPFVLKQILMEKYLIEADDGWIFRRARFYRGALQAEDEAYAGRELLLALIDHLTPRDRNFALLREAVRLLPHGRQGAPVDAMRHMARQIALDHPEFEKLRIKIHVQPQIADAMQVRSFARVSASPDAQSDFEKLATLIETVFQPRQVSAQIGDIAKRLKPSDLATRLTKATTTLSQNHETTSRFKAAVRLLVLLRQGVSVAKNAPTILALIDAGLDLEREIFRLGHQLPAALTDKSRRENLSILMHSLQAVYGIGLINHRQLETARDAYHDLVRSSSSLWQYKQQLDYLARITHWSDRHLRFFFSDAAEHFKAIEPLVHRYFHDRLRGSPLMIYGQILEKLTVDANRLTGLRHLIFDTPIASGVRGLNPGLARGPLKIIAAQDDVEHLDPHAIYLLPRITSDLSPVAGILSTGFGNRLSHVQLLARNLGIPNVAVQPDLLERLKPRRDLPVVMAVSPSGMVQIASDGKQWDAIFAHERNDPPNRIAPDLDKLDLSRRRLVGLDRLRATDSGRFVGPKAANLGELKHLFPDMVTDGVALPFGLFRELLDRPIEPEGVSVFKWMQSQYALIDQIKNGRDRQTALEAFLKRLRTWIQGVELNQAFRERLRSTLAQTFGQEGTYGVFVRSDTNIEDLPGFTGAGLNLTVPHVVGFESIVTAIKRVWASPFTQRAYAWRQGQMTLPQHVYASVLLMKSVPVEKSGVMVTADIDTAQTGWLTLAVNEGVGGAVQGQTAEELKIEIATGRVRLLAAATEPRKRILLPSGGVAKIAASGAPAVLSDTDIHQLINLSRRLPQSDPSRPGQATVHDVEFGFYRNKLVLFQMRPFVENRMARKNRYLNKLDSDYRQALEHGQTVHVDLTASPLADAQEREHLWSDWQPSS